MIDVLRNIESQYSGAKVQIPNSIFKDIRRLCDNKGVNASFNQISLMYSYLSLISILYKYSLFVNIDSGFYVQNGDIKESLGYSRKTKTIDNIIKCGGLLDSIGLTYTTANYPVSFLINSDEEINGIPIREYLFRDDLDDEYKSMIGKTIKNRNYSVKEPLFLTSPYGDSEYGTMYDYSNTHTISISELCRIFVEKNLSVGEFSIYGFIKSRNYGGKSVQTALSLFDESLNISTSTLYNKIEIMKEVNVIHVNHVGWQDGRRNDTKSNSYSIIG